MQTDRKEYVISVETDLSFDEGVNRTRNLLQAAGYGVLCEIDVKAKLEEKLGVEREPYMILGACNPPLASEGLNAADPKATPKGTSASARRVRSFAPTTMPSAPGPTKDGTSCPATSTRSPLPSTKLAERTFSRNHPYSKDPTPRPSMASQPPTVARGALVG